MSVKRSKSASRVLAVLEAVARTQPVGVSDLARVLDADKSAVQRAIMTLADEGWIHAARGEPRRWQLTGHIHAIAHMAHSSNDLRQRARAVLEALRDESGESVFLTTPDVGRFVVVDVLESRQMVRTAPHIGMIVRGGDSATGRVLLPYMSLDRRAEFLSAPPDEALTRDFAAAQAQGYFVSDYDLVGGSINIAAPLFEVDGSALGALVLSAPKQRVTSEHYVRLGEMVARAAKSLSRGTAPLNRAGNAG